MRNLAAVAEIRDELSQPGFMHVDKIGRLNCIVEAAAPGHNDRKQQRKERVLYSPLHFEVCYLDL